MMILAYKEENFLTTAILNECIILQHWVNWLEQGELSPEKRLHQTIRSGSLPSHILHHFACDCAEQAHLYIIKMGESLPPTFLTLQKTKRNWIEGKQTDLELLKARQNASKQHHEFVPSLLKKIGSIFLHASTSHSHTAARYASQIIHPEHSPIQQCQHLSQSIRTFIAYRHRLLRLLEDHHRKLQISRNRWDQKLEELLY